MRHAVVIAVLLSGCGVKQLLPEGPAMAMEDRTAVGNQASGVTYRGDRLTDIPVLPMSVWGLAYDIDLVLVTDHPEWNMHEIVRLESADGPIWMAKDAREGELDQLIVADLDNIDVMWPELPMQRLAKPVLVVDESNQDWLDLDVRYENHDGEQVHVRYEGPQASTPLRKRNGSTMGHSRNDVLAVLDLSHRDLAKHASVTYDGEPARISKVLGLVPLQMALQQTQGGLARGEFIWRLHDDGFDQQVAVSSGKVLNQQWTSLAGAGGVVLQTADANRSVSYRLQNRDGALELTSMKVEQFGRDVPAVQIVLWPALPDLRRRFDGVFEGRFVVDVNGQPGHALGRIRAGWLEDGPWVRVIPDEPWWVEDREMLTRVKLAKDQVRVRITMAR
jgi:hypothetical protein